MFNVFVLSFKTFISSVYSVTGIAMPLSILGISWSFISSIYSMCVCVYIYIYIYIYIYNKYRFKHRLGTGTVLKVSIWHRYRKKKKRYPTLLFTLLPSGKRFRSLMAKTERLRRSFFPQAIRLLNSNSAS